MPDMNKLEINGVIYDVRDPTKAPAGYGGFGETVSKFSVADEAALEQELTTLVNGMQINQSKRVIFVINNASGVAIGNWSWIATITKTSGDYAIVSAQSGFGSRVIKMGKAYSGGAWQPWEWESPPMAVGTEYRTTKRYMGKPVYTMLYDCGTNAIDVYTQKKVTPVNNQIHSLQMYYYGDYNQKGFGGDMASFWGAQATYDYGTITLYRTSADFGVEHCYALIEYTK